MSSSAAYQFLQPGESLPSNPNIANPPTYNRDPSPVQFFDNILPVVSRTYSYSSASGIIYHLVKLLCRDQRASINARKSLIGIVPSRFDCKGLIVGIEDTDNGSDFLRGCRIELTGRLERAARGRPVIRLFI